MEIQQTEHDYIYIWTHEPITVVCVYVRQCVNFELSNLLNLSISGEKKFGVH